MSTTESCPSVLSGNQNNLMLLRASSGLIPSTDSTSFLTTVLNLSDSWMHNKVRFELNEEESAEK
jgi:hypothetical protein